MSEPGAPFMSMWTIYDHPTDMPGMFVARRYDIVAGKEDPVATQIIVAARTLEEVRAMLPDYLFCIPASPGDDPKIVETWL